MGIMGAMRPAVVEICWCCSGTGQRLVSIAPFRFQPCPMCYGRRGRDVARHELQEAINPQLTDGVS